MLFVQQRLLNFDELKLATVQTSILLNARTKSEAANMISGNPNWAAMLARMEDATRFVRDQADQSTKDIERNSERYRFLRWFWILALERARDQGLAPGSEEAWSKLEEAHDVGDAISFLFFFPYSNEIARNEDPDPDLVRKANRLRSQFFGQPRHALKERPNYPSADELEFAAERYFKSDWRAPRIDRFVLRLLLERELAMFVHEMQREEPWLPSARPSKLAEAEKTLRFTLAGSLLKAVLIIATMVTAIFGLASVFSELPRLVPIVASIAVISIGSLWSVVLIYASATFGKRVKADAQVLVDQVALASDVLLTIESNGPLSLSDFNRDLERLRAANFVLPQTLYGMIDQYRNDGTVML